MKSRYIITLGSK